MKKKKKETDTNLGGLGGRFSFWPKSTGEQRGGEISELNLEASISPFGPLAQRISYSHASDLLLLQKCP